MGGPIESHVVRFPVGLGFEQQNIEPCGGIKKTFN